MSYSYEEMSEPHRSEVIDIFNHYIANSFAAYMERPVGYGFFDNFLEMARGYPSIVIKEDAEGVVGFGFLQPFHRARTFRQTAQITYFLRPEHTGKGLGTEILERFVGKAREQGIETLLAHISSRNEGSVRFHRRHGFRECGRFRRVGRKFGEDFDVVWMQLDL
jgi:L-amino acid N-acyltransferase YncA